MANYKSIGNIVAIINRYSQIYLMGAMEDLGLHGSGQTRIVLTLAKNNEGITQEELAKILFVDKASISRMITPLIKNGIVERITNPTDRRAYILTLTDKVKKNIPEIFNRTKKWTEILTQDLSPEDLEKLFFYLEKVEKNALRYIKKNNNEKKQD